MTTHNTLTVEIDRKRFRRLRRLEKAILGIAREDAPQPKDIDRWREIEKAAIEVAKAWDEGCLFEPPENLEPYRRIYSSSVLGRLREAVK